MDRLRIDRHLHRTARRQKECGLLEFKLVADLAVFPQEGHIEGKIKAFLAGLSLWFDIVRTVCSGCLGVRFPACRVAKLGDRVFPLFSKSNRILHIIQCVSGFRKGISRLCLTDLLDLRRFLGIRKIVSLLHILGFRLLTVKRNTDGKSDGITIHDQLRRAKTKVQVRKLDLRICL